LQENINLFAPLFFKRINNCATLKIIYYKLDWIRRGGFLPIAISRSLNSKNQEEEERSNMYGKLWLSIPVSLS
jgi:hypothetical protein